MMNDTDKKREALINKYGIEKIERLSIGAGHRAGYSVYFKNEIPKTTEEQEHICIFMTEYLFGYEIGVDEDNKRIIYSGYLR